MPLDRDPNIVRSGLSHRVAEHGTVVEVEIYRLEGQASLALEVVDHEGGSTVWEDEFGSDEEALKAFESVLADEGIGAFSERKVIPFPKRP